MYTFDQVYSSTLKYFNGNELATDVWLRKYALKDYDGNLLEKSPDDMHKRMAREFARIESKYKFHPHKDLSDYGKQRISLTEEAIFNLFKDFKQIIPQGSVMAVLGDTSRIGVLSNCFVVPQPYDSYGGILYTDQQISQVAKRRGGIGFDISTLRPEGANVKNIAHTSTGAISFMHRFSNTTREVALNGRRAALMLTIDCRHPDILEFINIKKMDNTKVTGANISVMWTDDFMEAVRNNTEYTLRWPVDKPLEESKYTKVVKARDIWDSAVTSAYKSAEPGMIFIDTMRNYSTCNPYQKIVSTNPCQPEFAYVLTEQGIRQIKDISVGDFIWSSEGWSRVTNKWRSGYKPVYEYNTTAGNFIGTGNHRVLSQGMKIPVSDADSMDILCGDRYNIVDIDLQAVMDGLVIGDGGVHKISAHKVYLTIGQDDQDYHNDNISSYIVGRHAVKHNAWKVRTTINEDELPHTYHRYIPSRYLYAHHNIVASFLRGLYSANGSVVGNRVSLKATSFTIIRQVQIMLSSIGIRSYYTTNKSKIVKHHNGSFRSKQSYDLNITTDRDVFSRKVGFIQQYKNDKLHSITHNPSNDKIKTYDITNIKYLGDFDVYDMTVDNESHTYWTAGINVSNCSEIAMGPDACRLIAINMFSSVKNPYTDTSRFDYDHWYKLCYEAMVLSDNLVDLELEHIRRVIDKIKSDPEPDNVKDVELRTWEMFYNSGLRGRRTGLGYTALGDTLAALGYKYDESLSVIDSILKTKFLAEWDATTDMSITRGAMPYWEDTGLLETDFTRFIEKEHPAAYSRMLKHGRRNVSISTVAPTGSVSLLAKLTTRHGTTSGIEPLFAPWYIRRKKINSKDKGVLIDFVDAMGDSWTHFTVFHNGLLEWADANGVDNVQDNYTQTPYYQACAPDISWTQRVDIQATSQKYTSHSISSTINLPATSSVEDVEVIYTTAYNKGLKGITVYVDGSRDGVLITEDKQKVIAKTNATKRPNELPCRINNTKVLGENWVVLVGFLGNDPYEVFAFKNGSITCSEGTLAKRGKGRYDLVCGGDMIIKDITSTYNSDEEQALTRLISLSLRHGADLKYIYEQLSKSQGNVVSFSKAINRTLKKFVPDDFTLKCTDCGSSNVSKQEGCESCLDCGSSKCG
jgi:ribonucleotide reductase alpha subunit